MSNGATKKGVTTEIERSRMASEVGIKEFFERVVDERDKQYDGRFRASEIAVNAALAAQEKAVTAAFIASEKAIIKAEDAQREYNVRSNEFRGQLDDQAKLLMQRTEALSLFKADADKIDAQRIVFDNRLEAQRLSTEKSFEAIAKDVFNQREELRRESQRLYEEARRDIISLRESRSETGGAKTGAREILAYIIAASGIALALIFHFVK